MDSTLKLNVGGTIFETRRSTLVSGSQFFEALLSDRWKGTACVTDEPLFLDRDPVGFGHVLNYLRDANYPFPTSNYRHELDFYGVNHPCFSDAEDDDETETAVDSSQLAGLLKSSCSFQTSREFGGVESRNEVVQPMRPLALPLRILPKMFQLSARQTHSALLSQQAPTKVDEANNSIYHLPFGGAFGDASCELYLEFKLVGLMATPVPSTVSELVESGILERTIVKISFFLNDSEIDSMNGATLTHYNLNGDSSRPPLPSATGRTLRDTVHREESIDRFSLRLPMFQVYLAEDGLLRPTSFFTDAFGRAHMELEVKRRVMGFELVEPRLRAKTICLGREERDVLYTSCFSQWDLAILRWNYRCDIFGFSRNSSIQVPLDSFGMVMQITFSIRDVPEMGRASTFHRIRRVRLLANQMEYIRISERELLDRMADDLFFPRHPVYTLSFSSDGGFFNMKNCDSVVLDVELREIPNNAVVCSVDCREKTYFPRMER